MKKVAALPLHFAAVMDAFHKGMSDAEQADPRFAYRVAFVPKVGNRASNADLAVEFIKADSDEAREISRVLLKEVDRKRDTASQVVALIRQEGYPRFNLESHTELWQALGAKDLAKGFGCEGDCWGAWLWWESWLAGVTTHCQEHADRCL